MARASCDTSTRFILPFDAPWVANLAALWSADPALAERVEDPTIEAAAATRCAVSNSKSGAPTLAWKTEEFLRAVQLHSRYDPIAEAAKLIDATPASEIAGAGYVFVHGLALGYHVEKLFDRLPAETTVFIFEPRLEIVRAALESRNLSKFISAGRLQVIVDAEKSAVFARLSPCMALASLPVLSIRHAPSIAISPAEFAAFDSIVADFLAYARTSVSTLVTNGRRTAENIIANLPAYVSTPSLSRLCGAAAKKPAIIVSAGPSLTKNKHLLHEAAGHAVIIAVQTTLQPLLEMGIRPDFVTSLDYHDICTRFFEKLPADLETELVAEPKASGAVFDLFPGAISILGNDFAESLLAEMRVGKTKLRAGATVAHLAFYLAEHLGCDPIIFVGQDLGFSDGLCYAPGTSYEDVWRPEMGRFCTAEMKQWEQIVRDRPILRRAFDHAGRPTYTEERLFTYLQQFERDFAASPARVIDATEGGIAKAGARSMTLRAALDEFCASPIQISPRSIETPNVGALHAAAMHCLANRRREAAQIVQIGGVTIPLLEEIRDNIDDQGRVNRAIAKIDSERRRLEEVSQCYTLVTQLAQPTELKRFHHDRALAAAEVDPTERQRRQVMRDIENVRGITEAAELLDRLLATAEQKFAAVDCAVSGRAA